jgi:hypothetical protein
VVFKLTYLETWCRIPGSARTQWSNDLKDIRIETRPNACDRLRGGKIARLVHLRPGLCGLVFGKFPLGLAAHGILPRFVGVLENDYYQ